MDDRAAQILEAVIQNFIATGEPVSSGWLYEHCEFGIKPAMIRLELDALEDAGYLEQPYHSAGRKPTDHGYEFFAERAQSEDMGEKQSSVSKAQKSRSEALRSLCEREEWDNLIHQLSDELGLLGVVADLARDAVYKSGLEELVNSFDWQDRTSIRSVIRDFEEMDERLPYAVKQLGNPAHLASRQGEPQVFIGKKSPVTRSENLSVVGVNYQVGDTVISILAIGPKRMDYRKTIRMLRML